METRLKISIECRNCKTEQPTIKLTVGQLIDYAEGIPIQEALPQLTPAERELLISGYCQRCFDLITEVDDD